MADDDDDLETPDGEGEGETVGGGKERTRAKIARLEAEAAEAQTLKRKLAFLEAGFTAEDLAAPGKKYFVEGYKGDLTADAIRIEAQAAGFLPAPEPTTPLVEQAGIQRMNQLAATGSGGTPVEADFVDRINRARTPDEVDAIRREFYGQS